MSAEEIAREAGEAIINGTGYDGLRQPKSIILAAIKRALAAKDAEPKPTAEQHKGPYHDYDSRCICGYCARQRKPQFTEPKIQGSETPLTREPQ
jgi:hypothetical protein